MSVDEQKAFNHELPQINLVIGDVATRTLAYSRGNKVSTEALKNYAHELFMNEGKPALSANAFSAAQKDAAFFNSLL
jgi:hypothetical protein